MNSRVVEFYTSVIEIGTYVRKTRRVALLKTVLIDSHRNLLILLVTQHATFFSKLLR